MFSQILTVANQLCARTGWGYIYILITVDTRRHRREVLMFARPTKRKEPQPRCVERCTQLFIFVYLIVHHHTMSSDYLYYVCFVYVASLACRLNEPVSRSGANITLGSDVHKRPRLMASNVN